MNNNWTALENLLNGANPFPQNTLETDTGIFAPKHRAGVGIEREDLTRIRVTHGIA